MTNVANFPAACNTDAPTAPALLAWYSTDGRTHRLRYGVAPADALGELAARLASGEIASVTLTSEHVGFREHSDFLLRQYEAVQHNKVPSPSEMADRWHAQVAA